MSETLPRIQVLRNNINALISVDDEPYVERVHAFASFKNGTEEKQGKATRRRGGASASTTVTKIRPALAATGKTNVLAIANKAEELGGIIDGKTEAEKVAFTLKQLRKSKRVFRSHTDGDWSLRNPNVAIKD